MHIGYLTRKRAVLSRLGNRYLTELKKYALIWLKLLQTSEFLRKMSIEFSKIYGKYIENAKK